ncbi:MAG: hypothetical protein IPM20_03385 [Gammaproteobacteria bacterium]|nr:hypothetical protein [Gammaproteobacteria bacterium]
MKLPARHMSIALATALLLTATAARAAPATDPVAAPAPARATTMGTVEQAFGKPDKILPAVGNPPITRWIYPDFTVYFERQYVIHSVTGVSSPATP